MIFTEGRFFGFFCVVFAVHWALRSPRPRKLWLLAVSYGFYACWDWRFLALLWATTALDYACARAMEGHAERPARRPWLCASVVLNLAKLGFFKYADFFVSSAAELLRWLGFEAHPSALGIALPLGISFYTFQTMSYTIDVYRGRQAAVRDGVDFALYVAFFPHLVAGPIVRGVDLLPQIAMPRRFAQHVALRPALTLFLTGFVKKACLADGIAVVVDPAFADPGACSTLGAWLTVALYHVQIYCDFSGYSDMAIATAGLLGYRLPLNFSFPYFARGIGEFWRRWHITLATWMRDYLYLPLIGTHSSTARRMAALVFTMGLCGLWHGAGWQFVSFGLLHGTYLAVEELWKGSALRDGALGRLVRFLGCPLLNFCVLLTWPVFRIGSFADTRTMFAILFGLHPPGAQTPGALVPWFLLGCTLVHWAFYRGLFPRIERLPRWLFAVAYGFAWALVLPWVADDVAPFIYFQF